MQSNIKHPILFKYSLCYKTKPKNYYVYFPHLFVGLRHDPCRTKWCKYTCWKQTQSISKI